MKYYNGSRFSKTFYGVTFRPGESKDVPGYINHPKFIAVASMPKEPPVSVDTKKRGRPKKKVEPELIEELHIEQEEVLNGPDSN